MKRQAARLVEQLHSPDRSVRDEAKVREWIKANPNQSKAFELATLATEYSSDLPAPWPRVEGGAESKKKSRSKLAAPVAVGLVSVLGMLIVGIFLARDESLNTGPGEQRTVELADGSEVSLNANSRVWVHFDKRTRKVSLETGEALFDVAKNPARPFVVVIGDHKVIALGTSFVVRREDGTAPAAPRFAVTLIDGRIAVEPISGPDALPTSAADSVKLLKPGERMSIEGDAQGRVDTPKVDTVMAWRRGQLIFEDTSLSEAAAEFNRYNSKKLIVDGAVGRLRVGGVFRIGDPASFAQAVASMYHLRIINRANRIILTALAVQ